MAITKQKGDIAEAFVVYILKANGFNVLIPWGEDTRYDIVSEKNGIFKRIQVKYVTQKNGYLEVAIRSCNNHSIIHYSLTDIDTIAAFDEQNQKVYFIPLNRIKNKSSFKLRLLPTKNQQNKFIHQAAEFESNFLALE